MANIEQNSRRWKFQLLKITYFRFPASPEIRKVKAVILLHLFTTGHITRQTLAARLLIVKSRGKVKTNCRFRSSPYLKNLCTAYAGFLHRLRYATWLFWPSGLPRSLYTFHRVHSNQPGIPQHIAVLHENPGTRCIYWE